METTEQVMPQKLRGFSPGVSGNPRGKKKGTRNRATVLAQKLVEKDIKAVMGVISLAALSGDLAACKLIAERILPPIRPTGRIVKFDMPSLKNMGDVSAAHDAILQAVAGGALSIDEGNALSAVVERAGKALYESDLERRLESLERAQNAKMIEGRMV
jgi:hypothetical protein